MYIASFSPATTSKKNIVDTFLGTKVVGCLIAKKTSAKTINQKTAEKKL